MNHFLTTIFAVFVCCTISIAQTTDKPKLNAISLEVGKTGTIFSLNFDHKLAKSDFGFRAGVGSNFAPYLKALTAGGGGYHLIGKTFHFLELGADIQYLEVNEVSDDQRTGAIIYPQHSIKTLFPSLNVGYRLYGKHTLFRIGFSPGLIEKKVIPGGYISYGFAF